ncbi:MAG TPA: TraR/DksA C4-type zinc finger protein [Nevskiaceae bacterium]|nr:TraR/DksA C4-type zinc finger protein [Nevskiaceae bacterium]
MDAVQERQLAELEDLNARARVTTLPPQKLRRRCCRRCGEPIPPARLKAVPLADHCIDCGELNELRDSQRRRA